MAVLAGIGGVDVITRLAFCSGAVVATGTGRRHAAVIEHRARPAVGAVAVIAAVAGCDVIEGFTRCGTAIVATEAGSDHGGVIDLADR